MIPSPQCPECKVDLVWPVPPDTPRMMRVWVGGPYICPKCGEEYDVKFVQHVTIRLPEQRPSFVMTAREG